MVFVIGILNIVVPIFPFALSCGRFLPGPKEPVRWVYSPEWWGSDVKSAKVIWNSGDINGERQLKKVYGGRFEWKQGFFNKLSYKFQHYRLRWIINRKKNQYLKRIKQAQDKLKKHGYNATAYPVEENHDTWPDHWYNMPPPEPPLDPPRFAIEPKGGFIEKQCFVAPQKNCLLFVKGYSYNPFQQACVVIYGCNTMSNWWLSRKSCIEVCLKRAKLPCHYNISEDDYYNDGQRKII